ncbi:hypothetical protein BC938DRAFT_476970 [Jimgerdemannia flammicorona]|uniref:Uncharacterized protein n=1 Tax=Jimgerdemannia flammicorona TaxID=994334 RepID=A0A433QPZ9_9FUNG|nr:hypothetical protein BC938DRAFT_476970 [Jimgerdemannia flammicorona]
MTSRYVILRTLFNLQLDGPFGCLIGPNAALIGRCRPFGRNCNVSQTYQIGYLCGPANFTNSINSCPIILTRILNLELSQTSSNGRPEQANHPRSGRDFLSHHAEDVYGRRGRAHSQGREVRYVFCPLQKHSANNCKRHRSSLVANDRLSRNYRGYLFRPPSPRRWLRQRLSHRYLLLLCH